MTPFLHRFAAPWPVVGVVHLPPLPGSAGWAGDMAAVLAHALEDARRLAAGGCAGLIVENFHDAPFHKQDVGPATVAAMAAVTAAVVAAVDLPVGVNVLRNDAAGALGVAVAAGAAFIRVNVHVGAAVTDQGLIEGRAADTLRLRRLLAADVAIAADVLVKHAVPFSTADPALAARDTVHRGRADALIVTGTATGAAFDADEARAVRAAVPGTPVLAGSGVTPDNAAAVREVTDGAIVGSWFHEDGVLTKPVDLERVRAVVRR